MSLNDQKDDVGMHVHVKVLIFTTVWMVFRAVGAALFLILGAIGSDRAASSDWTIAFLGDFVIGTTALFIAYHIWKKPSALLWGVLLKVDSDRLLLRLFFLADVHILLVW